MAALAAAGLFANPAVGQHEDEDMEFGINGLRAYDGECDDPRFRGPGMSSAPSPNFAFQDAADCRSAFDRRKIWLSTVDKEYLDFGKDSLVDLANDGYCDDPRFEGPGMADSLKPNNVKNDAFDCRRAYLLERTIWLTPASRIFGDDSGVFANDGECDDPRFKGPGMASSLDRDSLGRDRHDCELLLEKGQVQWVEINIDEFGNNSGVLSYNGYCNDLRFEGPGMANSLLRKDVARDAFDCARAHLEKRIKWVEWAKIPDNSPIEFGENSGAFPYDGECDDPRFEGLGMADSLSWGNVAKDASDCARAHLEERISLRADWKKLYEAVIFGKLDLVKEELVNGTDVNHKTEDGIFPLGLAAWTNEETNVINLLISKDADQTLRDEHGLTALAIAAMNDRSNEILQALLTNDSEQIKADFGLTPLHILAVYTEDSGKLDLFKESEILTAAMIDGRTALHLAAEHNETPKVISRLVDMGLDVDAKDNNGETPLYRAVFSENAQAAEELLDNGADPTIVSDESKMSPRKLAVDRRNQIICQLLVSETDPECKF